MSVVKKTIGGDLLKGVSAGTVIGLTELVFAIALGALIFGGQGAYVADGIGLILLGGILPFFLMSLFSSYRGSVAPPQDAPAAILAVMATGILASMPGATSRERFITVVAVVVVTTLLTGLLFLTMGQFKLGSLVRFLPYPVVGGFLAGTGWLLVTGGIGLMIDFPLTAVNLGLLFQPELILHWLPALVLALLMLWLLNRSDHVLILPATLVGTLILFYLVAYLTHTPFSTLSEGSWLLGPFTSGTLLQPFSWADLGLIRWDAILLQAGNIASVLLISIVSLLLNASAIELVIRKDLDLNRELRVAGMGNLASSFLGGAVSYHTLSTTTLNHKLSKGSPITNLVIALFFALPLFFGAAILSFIPKMILASLLILFGLSFLYEWVILARLKFSRLEYIVIVLILIAIAALGYLPGVGIGIVAAVGLFVVNYSRVDVTKYTLSGAEQQSRFTRSPSQRKILTEQGHKTLIMQLQGFIFFGTANKLLEEVRHHIKQSAEATLQFLVLDFSQVSGLDSTAMLSFSKMTQILQEREITTLVAGCSPVVLNQLKRGGFVSASRDAAIAFPDLDHGLEWVENQILSAMHATTDQVLSLREIFEQVLPDGNHLETLFHYLERREVDAGEYLMHQNDAPDDIYFVESGQVTAQLENPGQPPVRLETMKSGRVIGELGFYLGQKRTAGVMADESSVVYILSSENLAKMEKSQPETASYFHHLIIQLMAERTTHLIRTVAALEK